MKDEQFEEMLDSVLAILKARRAIKSTVYAENDDCYSNFKNQALARHTTVPEVLLNLQAKHVERIRMFSQHNIIPTRDDSMEYCGDTIIYYLLLLIYWLDEDEKRATE